MKYNRESFKTINSNTIKNNYKLKSGENYNIKMGYGKDFKMSQGHYKGNSFKNDTYGKASSSLMDSCEYNSISSG